MRVQIWMYFARLQSGQYAFKLKGSSRQKDTLMSVSLYMGGESLCSLSSKPMEGKDVM